MQCLYLSYDGMTDQLGQSQVIPYLKGLTQLGYGFTVISFEKKEAFKKNSVSIKELLKEYNIGWVPLTYHKSPPVLSTLWDFRRMLREATRLCKANKIEVIHCRSYLSALAGLTLKNKFGVKFIFDMRGFWADERVDGRIWNLSNPVYAVIYRYFKRKEKILLSKADHIISLTETAREIIQSWNIKPLPPITVIPCCADMHHFDPDKVDYNLLEQTRAKLRLTKGHLILGYLGAIGTWYMMEEMLDFFKVLFESDASARFLFVTNESPKTILNVASKKGIPNTSIIIIPALRAEVPLYISLMNVSIFFIKPVFSKKASSPTKMAELLSMGVPIICNSGIGDDDRVIEKKGAGILCHEMNIDGYKAIIFQLNTLFQKNKPDLRKIANDYYSLETGTQRYEGVYKSLIK